MADVIKRFCSSGYHITADCIAGFLSFYAQLAAGLPVSYPYQRLDISDRRSWCGSYYAANGKLSKYQGSIGKPGKEFEVGVRSVIGDQRLEVRDYKTQKPICIGFCVQRIFN